MKIQSVPNPDSPNNEAFEAIVELYYQACGYITSSGKWFWVWEEGKKQRGYQDIDVLAINEEEVAIVSVTSNLDDKIRKTRKGTINENQLKSLFNYFDRIKQYLSAVPQYQWLVATKKLKFVIAYNLAYKNAELDIIPLLAEKGIEVISAKEMLSALAEFIKQPNLKIQNQMLRIIQLLESSK